MSEFVVFGKSHILFMVIGTFLSFLFVISGFKNKDKKKLKCVAIFMVLIKISEVFYCYYAYNMSVHRLYPLFLCDFALIIGILIIFYPSNFLFQFIFYWCSGSFLALFTPDLYLEGFNLYNITFFVLHFFVCAITIYCLIHFKMYPTVKGMIISLLVADLAGIPIYFLNNILGTNYYYVNDKPFSESFLDLFGEWPYYILGANLVYIIISIILYLPFRKYSIKNNSKE